ncbi:MAG: RNA-binding protein Cwf29 [Sporothrix thermara]
MNKIRQIQELNKKELEQGVSPNASWHTDYRDTAFIYFGGLPYDLSEGDVITIFSQYGEPVFLKLARDQETGKSKGFGWLKYEDQRSCDLAVDNLGGATIGGRLISVDHARYKARDDEDAEEFKVGWADIQRKMGASAAAAAADNSDTDMGEATPIEDEQRDAKKKKRTIRSGSEHQPLLREERELQKLIDEHDDEDPMKEFLVEEKKKEVDEARRRRDAAKDDGHSHRHRSSHRSSHRSHRSHRSRRDDDEGDDKEAERREHRLRRRNDGDDNQRRPA